MNRFLLLLLTAFGIASCDCVQQASGVVLDKQTGQPLYNVTIGKPGKNDSTENASVREYTDASGRFDYYSISGGIGKCPDLVLYFSKPGYNTVKMSFASFTQNDTVSLEKIPFNRDAAVSISRSEFDRQVDDCIDLLKTTVFSNISDGQHVQIMYCLNTIFVDKLEGGRYDELKNLSEEKHYTTEIITIYTKWVPNRGMGFYFPDLAMELYGTPMPCSTYCIIN